MSAAFRSILPLALLAAPLPAVASPFTDAVETAVFTICPALHEGRISSPNFTALTRLGYRRTPEVEEEWADAEDGVPFVFVRGTGAEAINLEYWARPDLCSVSFSGTQAPAAIARVRARIALERRAYRRVAATDSPLDDVRVEAWRVAGRVPMCLSIGVPEGEEGSKVSGVSFEPFTTLLPGTNVSSCAPARTR